MHVALAVPVSRAVSFSWASWWCWSRPAEGGDVGCLSLDERRGIDGLFIAWDIIQL